MNTTSSNLKVWPLEDYDKEEVENIEKNISQNTVAQIILLLLHSHESPTLQLFTIEESIPKLFCANISVEKTVTKELINLHELNLLYMIGNPFRNNSSTQIALSNLGVQVARRLHEFEYKNGWPLKNKLLIAMIREQFADAFVSLTDEDIRIIFSEKEKELIESLSIVQGETYV